MTELETLAAADLGAHDDGDGQTLGAYLAAANPSPDELRCVAYFWTHVDPNAPAGDGGPPLHTAAAVTWTTTERGRERLAGQPGRMSLLDPDDVPRPWYVDGLAVIREWWTDTHGDTDPADVLMTSDTHEQE